MPATRGLDLAMLRRTELCDIHMLLFPQIDDITVTFSYYLLAVGRVLNRWSTCPYFAVYLHTIYRYILLLQTNKYDLY